MSYTVCSQTATFNVLLNSGMSLAFFVVVPLSFHKTTHSLSTIFLSELISMSSLMLIIILEHLSCFVCVCFCSYVLPDTSKKSCQKTRALKRTASPVFNHTMVYDGFRTEDLKDACVELTVWDRDRLSDHLVGGLRLGLGTGTYVLLKL